VTRDGKAIELLLPRLLTEERGITAGDPVLVFRRFVGHAAVVDVLPALTVKETESGEIEMTWPEATESQPTEAQVAKRYEEGPAALLTDFDLERLVDAARGKPARRIKILA
jgi:hypothetical protein